MNQNRDLKSPGFTNQAFARLLTWSVPLTLIVAAALIYFARALQPGQTIFANDMDFAYSTQMLLAEQLRAGDLPFWHPYVSSGLPLFVWDPLFYPPHLVAALLPVSQSFAWAYIFHFALAGVGAYLLLKQLEATALGATVGALVFMFNGYTVLRIFAGHFTYVYAAAWIPLIFYFAEKTLRERRFEYVAAAGAALGMQALCAVFQLWLYTTLLLAIYLSVRIFTESPLPNVTRLKTILASAARGGLIAAIGVGIGAVYWLPALASQSESLRSGGLDFATATSSSFPPTHLINLVLPNILGTDIDQNYWGYFLGYISQIESGIYVGILPLILALGTVRDFKRSQVLALLVVAVCALVLALGRFTPAFRIVYALPGISSFRIPARMLILFCFALSILAGLGTSRVQSKCQDRSWLRRLALAFSGLGIFFLLLGLIARLGNPGLTALAEALARAVYASAAGGRTRSVDYALGIVQQVMPTLPNQFVFPAIILLLAGGVLVAFRRTPRFALTLLGIIIAFDLAWFSWRYLVVVPVSEIIRPGQKKMLAYLDASPERARIYAEDTLLPTNMGNVFGFANVQSGFPQVSKRYRDLINCGLESSDAVLDLGFFKQFNARALQLLNAATAFTLKPVESSDWKTVAQENVQIIAYDHARSDYPVPQRVMAYVSKSINALPRAFVVYDAQVIADDAATLQTIYRSDFDPARQVVLDQPVGALGPVPASPALAQMQKYAPNQFALLATTDTPGILVLSEIFAPGWSATVDGKSVPVLRANYTLRAVYLSAGTHRVEFDYVPPGLATGLGITIGTGLGVVVVGAALIRRRSAREQGAKR